MAARQFQVALWPDNTSLYTTLDLKPKCLAKYALDPGARVGRAMEFAW